MRRCRCWAARADSPRENPPPGGQKAEQKAKQSRNTPTRKTTVGEAGGREQREEPRAGSGGGRGLWLPVALWRHSAQ